MIWCLYVVFFSCVCVCSLPFQRCERVRDNDKRIQFYHAHVLYVWKIVKNIVFTFAHSMLNWKWFAIKMYRIRWCRFSNHTLTFDATISFHEQAENLWIITLYVNRYIKRMSWSQFIYVSFKWQMEFDTETMTRCI